MFQNGQLGLVVSGEYFRRYLWGARAPSGGLDFNYDLAKMPFCPATGERTRIYHGVSNAMSRTARDPDGAWKWMKVISTVEAQSVITEHWGSRAAHTGTHDAWVATNAGGGPEGLNYAAIPGSDEGNVPYPSSPVATVEELFDPVVMLWYDNMLPGKMSVQEGLDQMEEAGVAILQQGLEDFKQRIGG